MSTNKPYQVNRSFFMTVDPVHIGTGGYRLGRVDNSIARDAGTNLPKIPGTSLHGAARHYSAYNYNKTSCAGQKKHCGEDACPICYTFGHASSGKDGEQGGYAGVVSISDTRILFFPVSSMYGPVWVSTPEILEEGGIKISECEVNKDKAVTSLDTNGKGQVNLGWLMLKAENGLKFLEHPFKDTGKKEFEAIKDSIILVDKKYFSRIVNSNLEVRTSVSINPETGAAEDGALYTYEAIPRATFLWADIVVNDYRQGNIWENGGIQWKFYRDKDGQPHDNYQGEGEIPLYERKKKEIIRGWKSPMDVVEAGLEWLECLGVGGMANRGFGRMRLLGIEEVAGR